MEHKLNYFFNYIYEYSTPYGILNNNIPKNELSPIFKKALNVKNEEFYNNKILNYFHEYKNVKFEENIFLNFKHYHEIHHESPDHVNIYPIENYQGGEINVSPRFIQKLKMAAVFYFVFYNTNINNFTKIQKGIVEFKKKNKITKDRIVFLSPTKVSSAEWIYYPCDDSLFEDESFISLMKKNLYKLKNPL